MGPRDGLDVLRDVGAPQRREAPRLIASTAGEKGRRSLEEFVETRDGDTRKAARNALPKVLRKKLKVDIQGEQVAVGVRIPIFVPGLYNDDVRANRKAVLPN